ncbi:MAG: transcriptional regulator [SAR86 cluster bacterium]|jgi:putative transcriptional regulator|uniref:Transcriptional regulator n=1 Tax=SAR86 cluster bacterium TaxID=2030880 RepID=A0A520M8D4_9GAMM|nr:MAG: transcriptional regulator [SAR86 cluster bacterium]|tara:strand:+ start:208 stop:402 length:195 start_codon:yes stop_codon:yes gene_type:complete
MKNNLKNLRDESKLSQDAFGSKLNVSRQTINSIENGKFDPSLPLAMKIAKFFNKKIEDIFYTEN